MNRRLLILIIILVVALAGAGVWWYFNQDQVKSVLNPNSNATNTNTVSNTNAAPVNGSLVTEQKGTTAIDFKTTVNDVEVHFSSASKLTTFAGEPAEEGKSFIVVYFDALASDKVLAAQAGLYQRASVLYRGGVAPMTSLKVASDVVSGDRGYLKFILPADATSLKLQIGDDGKQQTDLPL